MGYAYAGPYRTRPAYRFSVENSIYIAPDAHRRGIGRALLERLIAECEPRGYRLMIAVIGDSAQTPSIELHRAAGFKLVGTFEAVGYKFDRWLDTVLMQRPLGKAAAPSIATQPGRDDSLRRDQLQRLVDRAQHVVELVSALDDQPGRRDHAVGALLAREPRILLDAVERALRTRGGRPKTPRGLSGNRSRNRATRRLRPCGHRGRECGRARAG